MDRIAFSIAFILLTAAPAWAGGLGDHPCSTGGAPEAAADLYRKEVRQGLGGRAIFFDLDASPFVMTNIRTVEVNATQAMCKGTLHAELKPSALALKQADSQSDFLNSQLGADSEAQYSVEITDDGQPFITIY